MSNPHQPVQLRLNAEAIGVLFPEGSEARLSLQNAVIAEFIRKNIRGNTLGSDVQEQVERARTDAMDAVKRAQASVRETVYKELGVRSDGWNRPVVEGDARKTITEQARLAVNAAIAEDVKKHIDTVADTMRGRISHDVQAAVARLVDKEIAAGVKARVEAVMNGIAKVTV